MWMAEPGTTRGACSGFARQRPHVVQAVAVAVRPACGMRRWWRNLFLAQVYAPAAEARKGPLLAIDYHGRLFQARPSSASQSKRM